MKRALISVADKSGVVDFARGLEALGYQIISTGGTAALLQREGLNPVQVDEVTGFPEMMDGRLKTLHPKVHGGLLMRRHNEGDLQSARESGIDPIEIVCVNLYPFAATVSREHTLLEAIENIDIGGPAMIRSAAKNHPDVVVVTNPAQYALVLTELQEHSDVTIATRQKLAVEAFLHTGHYDSLISMYFHRAFKIEGMPMEMGLPMRMVSPLRYGENPHQKAAFYAEPAVKGGLSGAKQLQGKELSFCNLNDADTALRLAMEFSEPAAVAVKHATPCGVAVGATALEAYKKAHDADPVSIFGGIVAINRVIDVDLAHEMTQIFLDVILAPGFSAEALEVFAKKKNLRLLQVDMDDSSGVLPKWDVKRVLGGYLLQEPDLPLPRDEWRVVTDSSPSEEEWRDLYFAWTVVKYVKSNAIVLVKDGVTLGIGVGQTNRRDATLHALASGGEKARGAVVASDAFFPMPDSVEYCAKAGVRAIIHPGGSLKDEESVKVATDSGMTMVMTGQRHFRH